MTRFKTIPALLAVLCSLALAPASQAHAQSNGSEMSGLALFSAVAGSVTLASQAVNSVKDAGSFLSQQVGLVVRSASQAGQYSVLALHNASGAPVGTVSVLASSLVAGSALVGQSVMVVVESSGTALYAGSQLIAYIPNESAKQWLFHEKINN